jgi:DNA invertase Pin-like site-specific DNA recombinase
MGDVTRPELQKLQNIVAEGDTVLVRSLLDLADKPDDLISLLNCFGDTHIEVVSIVEPYYKYGDSFLYLKNALILYADFSEKKRRLGIERAKAEGRMGRKCDEDTVSKVKRLKNAGFSTREIVSLCRISRSTYYRMIKM